jgi:hypothetical protein
MYKDRCERQSLEVVGVDGDMEICFSLPWLRSYDEGIYWKDIDQNLKYFKIFLEVGKNQSVDNDVVDVEERRKDG